MARPNADRQMAEDGSSADGRRTGTSKRIHDVALAVFSERGWDGATMREIAERLQITRPALYHHYRSKEDILASIHRDLAHSVDGILDWGRAQPATAATRAEILLRLAALMVGEGTMPRTVPTAFSSCAGMDIGLVVDLADDGNAPYAFTGTVKQLVFDLKPTTYEDEKTLLGLSASVVLITAPEW